jgi:predicted aspartyl protease
MRSALWILLMMLTNGGSTMPGIAITDLELGDRAYAAGDFIAAEAFYRDAYAAEPTQARMAERLGLLALWRNDLPVAEDYLKAARKNRTWLTRRWPNTVDIDFQLALACVRGGRVGEAADLLRKAAGPVPIGPLKALKVEADRLALFSDERFYRMEGAYEAIIPFMLTDPLPVVQVSVNDSEPVNFFIDTGGEGITLDRAFAERLGIKPVGEYAGEYAGSKQGMTGYGKAERVRLGEFLVSHVPISMLDLEPISRPIFSGMPIGGILGTGFFMRILGTIDYPGQRLVLRRKLTAEAAISRALGLDRREKQFPIWLVETHLIFADGALNGLATAPMLIDTGLAGAGFTTSKSTYADADVEIDWSKAVTGVGGGGEVQAAEVTVKEVLLGRGDQALRRVNLKGVAMKQDNSLFTGALGFKVGGLISHQFFRDYALTLDFHNMHLILQ